MHPTAINVIERYKYKIPFSKGFLVIVFIFNFFGILNNFIHYIIISILNIKSSIIRNYDFIIVNEYVLLVIPSGAITVISIT
jgi:hypothetical protein